MKRKEVMRLLILLFCLSAFSLFAETMSVEDALRHKLIQLQLSSKGGYRGDCVKASVQNNTAGILHIIFEPGRILDNTDPGQQDIIVAKKLILPLAPAAQIDTQLIGYCCQSHNGSPRKNQPFLLGPMAGPDLVKLCNYISANLLDENAVQNAIWTLSNNHLPASIGMPGDTSIAGLFQFCSRGMSLPPPWYHITYLYVPGKVFSNQPHRVHLDFEYEKGSGHELQMAVYDAEGNLMKRLLGNSFADAGLRNYHLAFDVVNWKHGQYKLMVMEPGREPMVRSFEI